MGLFDRIFAPLEFPRAPHTDNEGGDRTGRNDMDKIVVSSTNNKASTPPHAKSLQEKTPSRRLSRAERQNAPRTPIPQIEQQKSEVLPAQIQNYSKDVLHAAFKILRMSEGFYSVEYSLHTSRSVEKGTTLIHLNITRIELIPGAPRTQAKDAVEALQQHIRNIYTPDDVRIALTFTNDPDHITSASQASVNERRAKLREKNIEEGKEWAIFKKGPGTDLVIVAEKEGGRKSQIQITEERAPLRAQRLRTLQTLISALSEISKSDPLLVADESSRLKTLTVANAIEIRAVQALYKTRNKVYSAREQALAHEAKYLNMEGSKEKATQLAKAATDARIAYDRNIIDFDRALESSASALSADAADADTLLLLSDAKFNIAELPTQIPREQREAAKKVLAGLQSQLREYALSVTDGKEIGRGTNKLKTILGYLEAGVLSKKLLKSCEDAVRQGGRYSPDAIIADESGLILSEKVLEQIKPLGERIEEFRSRWYQLDADAAGLRAALRLGQWSDTAKWHSGPRGVAPTLAAKLATCIQEANRFSHDLEEWLEKHHIEIRTPSSERVNESRKTPPEKSGSEAYAFATLASEAGDLLYSNRDTRNDLDELHEAVSDPQILADIRVLAEIGFALRSHIAELAQTISQKELDQHPAMRLFDEINTALNNEEWELAHQLAIDIPKVLSA